MRKIIMRMRPKTRRNVSLRASGAGSAHRDLKRSEWRSLAKLIHYGNDHSADTDRGGWIQVNCTLFLTDRGQLPYVPWAKLAEASVRWRSDQRFRYCFFMRKSPGLRVRFYGEELDIRLMPCLVEWLEDAERRNSIRSFRFARYEAETFLFGGPAGMAIAHDWFDRDTRLVLRYETLPADDRMTLPRHLFSAAVLSELFSHIVEDHAEWWDVWKRLHYVVGNESKMTAFPAGLAELEAAVHSKPDFFDRLPPAARGLLIDACADCDETASLLRAAIAADRLAIGPRAWLTSASIFHWNRLGIGRPLSAALVGGMLELLDPHCEPKHAPPLHGSNDGAH